MIDMLQLRKKIKAKKPNFIRQDAHKKKKLGKKWRKPKGIHSKMRLKLRGYRKSVSKGYKSPKEVRGLHKSGLEMVLVNSVKELEKIKKERQGIVIAKKVGLKKKVEIIKEADKVGITVLNVKDSKKFLENIGDILKKKREEKDKREKIKTEKEKKKAEAAKKKKEEKEEKTEEEKREQEKEEKDKILTKKQ